MQAEPQCYIDTDGRVACDAGGTMQNPNPAPAPSPGAAAQPQRLTARPARAPECCVHILSNDVTAISPQNPGRGRIDCPERPSIHESEVAVVELTPDGSGGMIATLMPAQGGNGGGGVTPHGTITARVANASAGFRLPVCTVGPQDKEPVPCCLVGGEAGEPIVQCDDTSHPLHGQPASVAIAKGHTLELCPPPVEIPPCCVELGDFEGKNARLVCEDENHAGHLRPVDVEVSPDGTSAAIKVGDHRIEIPVCITETTPEEIPCCVRDGVLVCPGTAWHGMNYEDVMSRHDVQLLPCEDIVPPVQVPPDCCVRIDNGRAFLVCSVDSPWNGYELKPDEYQCQAENGQEICQVVLRVPGESNLITGTFPVCDEGLEPVPTDCCYDVATGTLVCSDTSSSWHGVKVSLVDMQGGPGAGSVMVAHPLLGSQPIVVPVCEAPTPGDCCFEPSNSAKEGAMGRLICQSDPALNGMEAILTNLNQMPDGSMIGTVSFPGGSARMPLCRKPPEECPDCPPPYFCCVNLDTKLFVCPANEQRHGRPADIQSVEQIDGSPWAVLASGQRIPACGLTCPAPEPCRPPGIIPKVPENGCPPEPGIPQGRPDIPNEGPGTPPQCPQNGTPVPAGPPDAPTPAPGTPPQCPQNGTPIPAAPPNVPSPGPGTPPQCPQTGTPIPQGPPGAPNEGPGTPACPPGSGGPAVPLRPPVM